MKEKEHVLRFKAAAGQAVFTGERYLPDISGPIQYEHYHRYLFSAPICSGKEVLDIACGEGYGSAVLAQSARSVIGIDIDVDAVKKARDRYGDRANLRFEHGSTGAIPLPDASVDILNSFETLEHFSDHETFMTEARRVLRQDGLMIISTPNRPVYSPAGAPPNEYHVRELDRAEFVAWLKSGFEHVALYEQRPTAGSLMEREGREGLQERVYWEETGIGEYAATLKLADPVYFVALASNKPLSTQRDSLLHSSLSSARHEQQRNELVGTQAVEITRLVRGAIERDEAIGRLTVETVRLNEEIIIRNREISRLKELLDSSGTSAVGLSGVLAQLSSLTEQAAQSRALLESLRAESPAKSLSTDDTFLYENQVLREQVHALLHSTSWRVTKPLRAFATNSQWLKRGLTRILRKKAQAVQVLHEAKTQTDAASFRAKFDPRPFLQSNKPVANIVVVQSGVMGALDACLASLSASTGGVPFCVTAITTAQTDVDSIYGVKHLRSSHALSSLATLRDSIGEIDEGFAVLLSDRLIAHAGWLEAVSEAFVRFPDAGGVAALILGPDGKVESAGSMIGVDARLHSLGNGADIRDPFVDVVKSVACAGAGFVAIKADVWNTLAAGLVDGSPFGAGLAFMGLSIGEVGKKTYLQPFARFTEISGPVPLISEEQAWSEAHQRWAVCQRFERIFTDAYGRNGRLFPDTRPRAVFVDAFIPKPDQDSGSMDVFWYLRILLDLGYRVSFIAAFEESPPEIYAQALRRWGIRVHCASGSESLDRLVIGQAKDAKLVIMQRVGVASHLIEPLRRDVPATRIVFGTVDLHYLREERSAIHERSVESLDRSQHVRREEINAVRRSAATIVVSRVEYDIIKRILPNANVHRIPIPRDIDRSMRSFAERSGVVFVGGFAHRPNIDAVMFLVKEIWPLVRSRLPHAVLTIVGSHPTADVLALDDVAAGVRVLGFVEQLDGVLNAARLSVAPLRFGAGIKGKVVSSLLHGLPCVLSKVASEGMGLVDNVEVLEGETASEIAGAIVRLHEDPDLWLRLADAGFSAAFHEYSVNNVAKKFVELLESIGLGSHTARPFVEANNTSSKSDSADEQYA